MELLRTKALNMPVLHSIFTFSLLKIYFRLFLFSNIIIHSLKISYIFTMHLDHTSPL